MIFRSFKYVNIGVPGHHGSRRHLAIGFEIDWEVEFFDYLVR